MTGLQSLSSMGTTAATEFERLLDDSHMTYQEFVACHEKKEEGVAESTIQELLQFHAITEDDVLATECTYAESRSVFGGRCYEVVWVFNGKLEIDSNHKKYTPEAR